MLNWVYKQDTITLYVFWWIFNIYQMEGNHSCTILIYKILTPSRFSIIILISCASLLFDLKFIGFFSPKLKNNLGVGQTYYVCIKLFVHLRFFIQLN